MKLRFKIILVVLFIIAGFSTAILLASKNKTTVFSDADWSMIRSLSAFRDPHDPSNAYQKNNDAIELGRLLFFSPKLSPTGMSCSSCHIPELAFCDTLRVPNIFIKRNTPTLLNTALNRWFFWDGRADSHWAQALEPMENKHELNSSRHFIWEAIQKDRELLDRYKTVFGAVPRDSGQIDHFFVNIGKSIAAFESTLISQTSAFDIFVKEGPGSKALNQDEIMGLQLFIGKGKCITCHNGFNFTDNEFHNLRLKQDDENLDAGRFDGIQKAKANLFNKMSVFNDGETNPLVKYITYEPRNWSEFKTPTLRNVAITFPYMHDGRFRSLEEVIDYYSELKGAQKDDHHSETIIKPLQLSEQEKKNIIAFLKSLTDTAFSKKKFN